MRTYLQQDKRHVDCATQANLDWLVDTLQQPAESLEERLEREQVQEELETVVREALRCLTKQERRIIKLRYLSGEVRTYREVSKLAGYTLSWTHTLGKRAEAKLGSKLKDLL